MKNKHPLFCVFMPDLYFLVIGVFLMVQVAIGADSAWNGFAYSDKNGEVTIRAYLLTNSTADIPAEINGNPVRTIAPRSFSRKSELQRVVIPDSVKEIGEGAFQGCYAITNLMLGRSVTNIGKSAFSSCFSLQNIKLPECLVRLGASAFAKCSVVSLTLPASLREYGSGAFADCTNLTEVSLASGNESFAVQDGVLFDRTRTALLWHPAGLPHSGYTVSEGVTSIADDAFSGSVNLTQVVIGSQVTNIGVQAFLHCTNLKKVMISDSVVRLGESAFQDCFSLADVTLGARISRVEVSVFRRCRSLQSIRFPDGVSEISHHAFQACDLTNVVFGAGLRNIGGSAFSSCQRLGEVLLPNGVVQIGGSAFAYCTALRRVVIPESVKTIGEGSFFMCRALAEIVVAEGNKAFRSVDGVLYDGNMRTVLHYPLARGSVEYRIPDGVTSVAPYAVFYAKEVTNVVIPASMTRIGESAFAGMDNLCRLDLPDALKVVGKNAFATCRQLDAVIFDGDAPAIDASAFNASPATLFCREDAKGWSNSTYYVAGRPVRFLDAGSALAYVPRDDGSAGIFRYLGSNSVLFVPALLGGRSVTAIADAAFAGNSDLKILWIPVGVTSLGSRAFAGCTNLEAVIFNGNAPQAGEGIFEGFSPKIYCASWASGWNTAFGGYPVLAGCFADGMIFACAASGNMELRRYFGTNRTVIVPAEIDGKVVDAIAPKAFAGCRDLKGVTISANVRRVGAQAFDGCYRLAALDGANDVTVDAAAFDTCYAMTNAVVPGCKANDAMLASGDQGVVSLRMFMNSGDVLTGTNSMRTLPFRLNGDALRVPLTHIEEILIKNGALGDVVRLRNGDTLNGKMESNRFVLQTGYAELLTDIRQISSIQVMVK